MKTDMGPMVSKILALGILLAALFPLTVPCQDHCASAPAPAPDARLFLIPRDILGGQDLSGCGLTPIHRYGTGSLAVLAGTDCLPPNMRSRLTPVTDVDRLIYRSHVLQFKTPAEVSVNPASGSFNIVQFFGPMDFYIQDAIRAAGLAVVGTAPPFGLVVKGDTAALERAAALCTSEGYRLIRDIFPVPVAARLSDTLRRLSQGEAVNLDATNILHTADGGIVVRVFPYRDGQEVSTYSNLLQYMQPASEEIAHGYSGAYILHPADIVKALDAIEDISYIEPLAEGGFSANIGMSDKVHHIYSVWNTLGYTGDGVIVLHNDGGLYRDHPDLGATVVPITQGDMEFVGMVHGTHTAALIAGRGNIILDDTGPWSPNHNMCMCRPRPEDGLGISEAEQPNKGDLWDGSGGGGDKRFVRGAAPDATLISNNSFDTVGSGSQVGWFEIEEMHREGSQRGATISSNSWWREAYSADPLSWGQYEGTALAVDHATRDADNTTDGNQEMLIVRSAGNNDSPTINPNTLVQCPGVAKNALTVGATENLRCGQARSYDCTPIAGGGYDCNQKIPRAPDAGLIYERSGRGPSQGRVKPDIVAVGANVLSAQVPLNTISGNELGYYTQECLDCRTKCNEFPEGLPEKYTYSVCDQDDWPENQNYCFLDDDAHNGSFRHKDLTGKHFCNYNSTPIDNFIVFNDTWTGPKYLTMSGTSMAAPIVAGAAAVFHEFYKDKKFDTPSPALVKAAFINGAEDLSKDQAHNYPFLGKPCKVLSIEDTNTNGLDTDTYVSRPACTDQGWGRLNLYRSIKGPAGGRVYFIDQTWSKQVSTDWSYSINFDVNSSAVPLKITLVWSDPSDDSLLDNDSNVLTNDLDLVVAGPPARSCQEVCKRAYAA